jgi:hypothetical protein
MTGYARALQAAEELRFLKGAGFSPYVSDKSRNGFSR